MPSCAVKWCRSHSDMKNAGITFHLFPKNEVLRKKWVAAVRLERNEFDWMPSEYSKLCSIHFKTDDMYICKNGKLNLLKKTAVPVCTMISSVAEPSRNSSSSSSSIQHKKNVDVQNEYSNGVNLDTTDEKTVKRIVKEPDCKNFEEKKPKLENNIKIEFDDGVEEELRETKFQINLVSTEVHVCEERGSCVTPINIPSSDSDIESALDTPETYMLKQKLRKKTILAVKRLSQIKSLQARNRRLTMKNISLKNMLSQLNKK